MIWKDTTSYSRSDAAREPRTFRAVVGPIDIIVTRHIHYPGAWVLQCSTILGMRMIELRSAELAAAQVEAVSIVRARVAEIARALEV